MRKSLSLASLAALEVAVLTGAGITLWATSPASAQQAAAIAEAPYGIQVTYTAGQGEANDVTITNGAMDDEYVIDDIVPIQAGEGCTHPDESDATRVTCTLTTQPDDPDRAVEVFLGDMDDALDAGATEYQLVYGGPGDDVLIDAGAPLIYNDFFGEDGDDTISGAKRQIGGGGNDTLTGTGHGDWLNGQWGHDTILGEGGDDDIRGAAGDDELHGGDGNDLVHGDAGVDTIYGDAGDDVLYGGQETDQIDGGPGNNEIHQDG
jgi:serralysin